MQQVINKGNNSLKLLKWWWLLCPAENSSLQKQNKKKCRLGLTSTYKYKTIHTSVWMLPQGGRGGGVIPSNPALLACATVVTTREVPKVRRLFPWRAHHTVPLGQPAPLSIQGRSWNGGGAAMGKGEISPPMGSIVSRSMGEKGEWSRVRMGQKRRDLRMIRRAPRRDPL